MKIDRDQGMHSGLPYVGLEDIESGTARFAGSTSPLSVKSNTFRFTQVHVLYGRLRPYLNKVLAPDFDGHCSTEIFPLKPLPNVLREFIVYWLLRDATVIQAQETARGARMPRANVEEMLDFECPLPSLAEQRRIVAILDEAFEGIAKARANAEKSIDNARSLFEGRLEAIFLRDEDQWPRRSLAQLLDAGWIEGHLDGNHGSDYPRKDEFIDSGVPYISANCIQGTDVRMDRAKYLSVERSSRIRKGVAHDGDVLFAHNATVGPVAILRTDQPKVILGTSLTFYRCNRNHMFPEYLAHYMRSTIFRRQYDQVMRQSTRNQVPITTQREFIHIVPKLDVQIKVARILNELVAATQHAERLWIQKIAALDELKKSLLHHAFAGEL